MNNIRYREDRFSIEYVLKESCEYENSILKSDKFLRSLNESEKMAIGDHAAARSLNSTRKKLEKLNKKGVYGDIPKSKGDVTKSENYKPVKQIISILTTILDKAKGPNVNETRKCFEGCKFAFENLEKNRIYFQDAYKNNDPKLILLYQNIYAGIVIMLTVLTINSLYINKDFQIEYVDCKKGTYDKNKLMKNIHKFNDMCRNNKLPTVNKFNEMMDEYDENFFNEDMNSAFDNLRAGMRQVYANKKNSSNLADFYANINNDGSERLQAKAGHKALAGLTIAAAVGGLAIFLIYLSRFFISLFFYLKNTVSDYSNYLSDVIYANSLVNEHDPSKSGKVAEKQKALSEKLKKVGKVLEEDYNQAEYNASRTLKAEDQRTSENLEDKLNPDNANTFDGDDLFI